MGSALSWSAIWPSRVGLVGWVVVVATRLRTVAVRRQRHGGPAGLLLGSCVRPQTLSAHGELFCPGRLRPSDCKEAAAASQASQDEEALQAFAPLDSRRKIVTALCGRSPRPSPCRAGPVMHRRAQATIADFSNLVMQMTRHVEQMTVPHRLA